MTEQKQERVSAERALEAFAHIIAVGGSIIAERDVRLFIAQAEADRELLKRCREMAKSKPPFCGPGQALARELEGCSDV